LSVSITPFNHSGGPPEGGKTRLLIL